MASMSKDMEIKATRRTKRRMERQVRKDITDKVQWAMRQRASTMAAEEASRMRRRRPSPRPNPPTTRPLLNLVIRSGMRCRIRWRRWEWGMRRSG